MRQRITFHDAFGLPHNRKAGLQTYDLTCAYVNALLAYKDCDLHSLVRRCTFTHEI